jgi:hypothetical protein
MADEVRNEARNEVRNEVIKEYIEREKVQSCLEDLSNQQLIGNDNDTFISLPQALDIIEELPAADVVEVRRGEWVEKNDCWGDTYYDCTACNESFCLIDGSPVLNLFNFCPNCGADMRGNNNDNRTEN